MAAAYKKKRSLPRDFITLIFEKGEMQINLSECILVHEELERDPEPISHIISDEEIMLQLLTNFDLYAARMARFFSLLNKRLTNSKTGGGRRAGVTLAGELIDKILVPFLGEDFAQFHLGQPFLDVFSCILEFCLLYSPRSLEKLAGDVVERSSLFGALISGKTTGGIMKQLPGSFKTARFSFQTIKEWAAAVIKQCDSCSANHDIEHHRTRWHDLEDLISRQRSALRSHLEQSCEGSGGSMDFIPDGLNDFGISKPNSVSSLEAAILKLEMEESVLLLKALGESFPCRPCYELLTNPSNISKNDRDERDTWSRLGFMSFSDLLGGRVGVWNVVVSAQALEDMQQAQAEGMYNFDLELDGSFGLVESTIVELASGKWERSPVSDFIGGEDVDGILYLALYEGDETHGILWQLDTEFDEEHDAMLQLIKIWRIGEIDVIVQAVHQIHLIHKTYSQERLKACRETHKNYPQPYSQDVNDRPRPIELDKISQEVLAQSLLGFNKFYTVTKLTFENIWAQNLTAEYPLNLAKEELRVVKDTKASTLVQGRSGTGKTTCLVYKMFGRYMASKISESISPPRQVLLTRSHILSSKLEGYTKYLLATHTKGSNSTGIASIQSPHNMYSSDNREVRDTVFTIDSFPLVCTFGYFIKLLENTLRAADRRDFFIGSSISTFHRAGNSLSKKSRRLYRGPQNVDFETFDDQYWPSFPENLKKPVTSTLAFMEIIGVIKGSACYSVDFRPLTREEYLAKGHMLSPIWVDRNHMYDIYEHYEKKKKSYGDADDIDRARKILQGMSKNPDVSIKLKRAFDEIYVDEVQDQRLLELMMLLHLIKTPNAIHFAGDTAQAISKDSVFRFQRVQDLLYARFSSAHNTKPKVCKLNKNYRTHQEILNIATSVIDVLDKNFQGMVDDVTEEKGQFSGPKPAVFVGFDSSTFSGSMFGATSLGPEHAQLGAEQVIIVRDSRQKEELQDEIGDFALILTVLESKGMEFEDVLVYNFFTTSPCAQAFRSVSQPSSFDSNKHIALCSELKQLYVAITRAQNRLWFFESNCLNREPMLGLWGEKVDIFSTKDGQAREKLKQLRPGSNANPEIWSARGYQFIEGRNYDTALVCFRRAKDAQGITLTKALISEKMAKSDLARGNEKSSETHFREAANLFHKCGEAIREAACYETLGDFERAADIFSENGEFRRAADLYTQLEFFEKAARNFALASCYNDGASVLARGNLFDSLVRYLSKYITHLDPEHQRHYSRLCNLLLKRGKISPELKTLAMSILRTDTEKEEFFREYEMMDELTSFLIERGRFSEACNLAIANGDLDKAWDLMERYGTHMGMAQLPQRDRVEIYNCRQVKILHKNLSSDPAKLFVQGPVWEPRCQWLPDNALVMEFWKNLPQELEDFSRHEIAQKSIVFSESWMRDIFNTIVTLKAHVFIDSADSLEQLPIESINTAIDVTKELTIGHSIPVVFLTLLRILPSQKRTGSFLVLASSPSLITNSIKTGYQDSAILVDVIAKWAVGNLCQVVNEMQEKANEMVLRTEPCIMFQYPGSCPKSPGTCKFPHRQLGQKEYMTIANDLLRINSVFCRLLPLFRQKFSGLASAGFMAEFRPRQRRWLERLLAKLIYVSSVEQSPEIIMQARNEIGGVKSAHLGVHGALDDLVFHKLKRDQNLDKMCEVSSLLELLQIAQILGARFNFERCLNRRVQNHSRAQKTWNTLQTITASLKFGICKESVEALDRVVQTTDCLDIQAFHAVITLYEKWAAYLIYNSNPGDVVLPDSWVQMYNEFLQITGPTDLESKNRNGDSLLSLTSSFCSLVERVNKAPKFCHKLSGEIRTWDGIRIFARRNVHFLTTCVLNTYSWRTSLDTELHLKCTRTRAHVDKVLILPTAYAPDLRGCSSYYNLGQRYLASFNIYNGKDYPRIVKANNIGPTFFSHLEPSFPRLSLADWRSAAAKENTNLDGDKPASKDLRENYAHMEPAVLKIQRIWKSQYPLVLKRREFFSSATGRAILYIQRVCQAVSDTPLFNRTEKLRLRLILFSDGLKYQLFAEEIRKMFVDSRNQAKKVLENVDVKNIESAQIKWEKLLEMQDEVDEGTGLLREGNWDGLRTTSKSLEDIIRLEHSKLRRIKFNLRLLDGKEREPVAAETIQRIWRLRRPILNSRRKFSETESGKTIAYVHRIVKALDARDELLDRKGKIQRAAVLFGQVVQLIHEVKRIEKIYQKVNLAIRPSKEAPVRQKNEFSKIRKAELAEIRDQVRKNVSFLMEANWMRLNVPAYEIEANCTEAWRVMRSVEYSLSSMISQRSSWGWLPNAGGFRGWVLERLGDRH